MPKAATKHQRNRHRSQLIGFPGTERWGLKERPSPQHRAPSSAAPTPQTRDGEEPRNRKRNPAGAGGGGPRAAEMELRALRPLWLLCCCFGGGGRSADPRATFTATEPRSRERQASAFRVPSARRPVSVSWSPFPSRVWAGAAGGGGEAALRAAPPGGHPARGSVTALGFRRSSQANSSLRSPRGRSPLSGLTKRLDVPGKICRCGSIG